MKKFSLSEYTPDRPDPVNLICPHCGHRGVFDPIGVLDIWSHDIRTLFGQRMCPNSSCKGHVFVIIDRNDNTIITYPSQTIPFNKEKIPERIILAFDEAIECLANKCFIASAIMIRKTLEEVCENKQATGDNLKKKISELGNKILIPKELLNGLDDLRLLGNDAAHIDANVFEEIGQTEIEISIEFTIEFLKAVYQYENLLNKLRSLKK